MWEKEMADHLRAALSIARQQQRDLLSQIIMMAMLELTNNPLGKNGSLDDGEIGEE